MSFEEKTTAMVWPSVQNDQRMDSCHGQNCWTGYGSGHRKPKGRRKGGRQKEAWKQTIVGDMDKMGPSSCAEAWTPNERIV